jgi:hypothetical protein
MDSFDQTLDQTRTGRVVRWPFRVLAALLLGTMVLVFLGGIYRVVVAPTVMGALCVFVMFPLVILNGRVVGYVVWKGRVLRNPFWPFPSGLVLLVWIGLFTFITLQLKHA